MSVDKDSNGTGKRRPLSQKESRDPEAGASKPRKKRPHAPEFGNALRSVYQQTVDESIPPEMLDLLGKLG